MGQAKQRGTKEERLQQARQRYDKKLKQLSSYGIPTEVLDAFFKGDEFVVSAYINQINHIVSHQKDVVNVTLMIKNGELLLDVETTGAGMVVSSEYQDLKARLDKIDLRLKPKSTEYDIKIANADKATVDAFYDYGNSFDLPIMQDKAFFHNLISENLPDMNSGEADYYSEMLALYSNHHYSSGKAQSFIFEKPRIIAKSSNIH